MGLPLRRLPWLVALLAALIAALVAATDDRGAIRSTPAAAVEVPPLPDGSTIPGREGAEASAIALADALLAVPTGPGADDTCPREQMQVSWKKPPASYEHGAYVTPVGPAPDLDTRRANGVVLCEGSSYGFMGFESLWDGERWSVFDVPYVGEHEEGLAADDGSPLRRLAAGLGDIRKGSPWYGRWGRDIEPLAPYEPQQVCDPKPKMGTLGFRALVFEAYPKTRNLGISRGCELGARSEHKEGRAWDWGVAVKTPAERKAANQVISWLMATDEFGHSFAMARRLGVMYVIWDQHIWSSYAASTGWRPYAGRSPHTDHVHISFSRAGGLGLTSFWEGVDLSELDVNASHLGGFPAAFPTSFSLGVGGAPPVELGPGVKPSQALSPLPRRTSSSSRSGGSSSSSSDTDGTSGTGDSDGTTATGSGDLIGGTGGDVGSGGVLDGGSGGSGGTSGTGGSGSGGGGGGGSGSTLPTVSSTSSTTLIPLPLPTTSTRQSTTTTTTRRTTTTTRQTTTTTIKLPLTTTTIKITTTLPTLPL